MTKEHNNSLKAKRSLKAHIHFMESILSHLNSIDKISRGRAVWAAWCIDHYFNDQLINDIHHAMNKNADVEETSNAEGI